MLPLSFFLSPFFLELAGVVEVLSGERLKQPPSIIHSKRGGGRENVNLD